MSARLPKEKVICMEILDFLVKNYKKKKQIHQFFFH